MRIFMREYLNRLSKSSQYLLVGLLALVLFIICILLIKEYTRSVVNQNLSINLQPQTLKTVDAPRSSLTIYASPGNSFSKSSEQKGSYKAQIGQNFTIAVRLKGVPGDAIDIAVTFDPQYLKVVSQEPGSVFKNTIVNKSDPSTVWYSGAVGINKSEQKSGGDVLYITFAPLATIVATTITFDDKKTTVAGQGQNTLNISSPLVVSIE